MRKLLALLLVAATAWDAAAQTVAPVLENVGTGLTGAPLTQSVDSTEKAEQAPSPETLALGEGLDAAATAWSPETAASARHTERIQAFDGRSRAAPARLSIT